jgi:serine/threonine-protein kinase
VASGGGTPEQLTEPDPEQEDHRWPDVLPTAEAVLFTIVRDTVENAQLAVLSLVTGEIKVLMPGGSSPRYVPSGHIVYAAGDTLRAVAFDLERLEVTSDPVPVLEGVMTKPSGAATFGVAEDGSLVYATGSRRAGQRTLVWVDRQGREEVLNAPPRNYTYPRLSPDGSRLALDVRDEQLDIWVWNFERETLTRLTFDPGIDGYPVWTPDGLQVAFGSGTPGNLFLKAADGTGSVRQLTESANQLRPQAFSPDGKSLLFRESRPGRGFDLGTLSLEGETSLTPLLATEFAELNGEISPNGRFLAYQSNESGRSEIYVRPYPNVEAGRWQFSRDAGTQPLSARNGRELFYVDSQGQLMAVPVQTESTLEFGNAEIVLDSITVGGRIGRTYDVSPDGERFLMITEAGASDVELILVQNWGEELKRLVPTEN